MKPVNDYINLLPREKKTSSRPISVWSVVIAAFALTWIILFGLKFKQRWDLQARLSSLAAQRNIVEGQVAAIRSELGLTAAPGTNPEKAALIQNLLKERVLWSQVFKQFSQIIPRGLWFDSLEGSSVGRAEIKIRGGAFNYLSIADFMLAMEQSVYFEKPQLLYAQKAVVQGHDVIGFEIICGIKKVRGGS
jgi:Tfp pilus assembly protein PilN